jgi:outer membrane lipoprotein carrier protein
MIKKLFKFALVGVGLVLAVTGQAEETGAQRLQEFMQSTQSLDATFTQEVVEEGGKISQTAFGKFYLQRPGKFRWEYQEPSPQQIIADGKKLWIYDIDLEQVSVRPLQAALGRSPAAILMTDGDLTKDYKIQEQPAREGMNWVGLTPKNAEGDFKQISIGLDPEGVQAMDLYDQYGRVTMIRFQESTYGKTIAASTFQFTPPEGVDVIGE